MKAGLFIHIAAAVMAGLPSGGFADDPVATVSLEAESGTLGSDFSVNDASTPSFITILTDRTAANPGTGARVATYSVTFPSEGTYDLYARIRTGAGSYNDDSMFAATTFGIQSPSTDADWYFINGLAGVGYTAGSDVVGGAGSAQSQVWKWLNLTDYTSSPGYTVNAGNLTRTFQIGAREDGLDIDKLVFGRAGIAFTVDALDNASAPPPPAPADLSAVPAGMSQIDLSWTASPGATSYTVKQSTSDGGPYTNVAAGVVTTAYTVMGLSPGTTYYYVVAAASAGGDGPVSDQAETTTALSNGEPPAPTGLAARAVSESRIDLSWASTPGAASYTIKRSDFSGGPYVTIAAGVSVSSFSDLGRLANTTYHYVVSAVNLQGEGPNSAPAHATTPEAFVAVEAESGTLGSDFNTLGTDPVYVTCTTDLINSGNPGSAERVAGYSIAFPSAGTYEIYARVYVGPGTYDDDSMFFAIGFGVRSATNDDDWVTVNGLASAGYTAPGDVVAGGGSAGSQVWKWVNLTKVGGAARLSVPQGNLTQMFQIGAREDGLNIDKFVFGKIGYPFTVGDLDNGTTPVLDLPIDSSVVDGAEIHQRIDGFGAGVVFLYSGLDPITEANADLLFGTDPGQFGLSLLRIRISPTGNDYANLLDAQKAVARGAKVMATPWTPPASMKDSNDLVGGSLLPGEYANYAAYLNDFAAYMKANGVELAAISVQNEADIEVSYECCVWTPEQLRVFCRDYAGAVTEAPLMMPESFRFDKSFSDPTLNDPAALANVEIIGGHLYGTSVSDYPNARARDMPMWMTEYLINDQTWATAMQTAEQIHDCLVTGNMSAYIWWKTLGDANGLLDNDGAPQRRGYVMGQFSRFVRPDFYRIGVNSAGAAKVSAFKDATGAVSIVAVNHSAVDVGQTFTLTNLTVSGSMTPWITSSNLSLAVQSPVPVHDAAFSYVLPAMSVVTFTGQIDVADLNLVSAVSDAGDGDVLIDAAGLAGLPYVLGSTDDLTAPAWTPVSTNAADAAGIVSFTNAPAGPREFYRSRSDTSSAHPVYP